MPKLKQSYMYALDAKLTNKLRLYKQTAETNMNMDTNMGMSILIMWEKNRIIERNHECEVSKTGFGH